MRDSHHNPCCTTLHGGSRRWRWDGGAATSPQVQQRCTSAHRSGGAQGAAQVWRSRRGRCLDRREALGRTGWRTRRRRWWRSSIRCPSRRVGQVEWKGACGERSLTGVAPRHSSKLRDTHTSSTTWRPRRRRHAPPVPARHRPSLPHKSLDCPPAALQPCTRGCSARGWAEERERGRRPATGGTVHGPCA